MTIEINDEKLINIIESALELQARLSIGHFEYIDHLFLWQKDFDSRASDVLQKELKKVYFPEFKDGRGHHGICSEQGRESFAKSSYDLYKQLQYARGLQNADIILVDVENKIKIIK